MVFEEKRQYNESNSYSNEDSGLETTPSKLKNFGVLSEKACSNLNICQEKAAEPVSRFPFNNLANEVPLAQDSLETVAKNEYRKDQETGNLNEFKDLNGVSKLMDNSISAERNIPSNLASVVNNSQNIQISLVDDELWAKFNKYVNEMIVTKDGRRMFPVMKICISGLDPLAMYTVNLDFAIADTHRWKFMNGKWIKGNKEDNIKSSSMYMHTDSPNFGSFWMSGTVVFSKLKISNKASKDISKIQIHSLFKYQPRIHIYAIDNATRLLHHVKTQEFKCTEFIAVTAYQNDDITRLKVSYNPFAKAFLDVKRQSNNSRDSPTLDFKKEKSRKRLQQSQETKIFSPNQTSDSSRKSQNKAINLQRIPPLQYDQLNHQNNQLYYNNNPNFQMAMDVSMNEEAEKVQNKQMMNSNQYSWFNQNMSMNNNLALQQQYNFMNAEKRVGNPNFQMGNQGVQSQSNPYYYYLFQNGMTDVNSDIMSRLTENDLKLSETNLMSLPLLHNTAEDGKIIKMEDKLDDFFSHKLRTENGDLIVNEKLQMMNDMPTLKEYAMNDKYSNQELKNE